MSPTYPTSIISFMILHNLFKKLSQKNRKSLAEPSATLLPADERDTAGIVCAVAVTDVMWCTQRYEVAAAVEVDTTRIRDKFTVAAIVSHVQRGEAAPVAAEPVATVVICKSVDAKASYIEF
jgi:hypothetical protein